MKKKKQKNTKHETCDLWYDVPRVRSISPIALSSRFLHPRPLPMEFPAIEDSNLFGQLRRGHITSPTTKHLDFSSIFLPIYLFIRSVHVTCMCGFWSKWKSSLQSFETWVFVDNRSKTSMSISIELESTGKNLSSLTLFKILLCTFTKAFNSFDCSNSLKNPNSSSVQLGISFLFSCREFNSLDKAKRKERYFYRMDVQ